MEKGKHSCGVMIMISGDVEAVINQKIRIKMHPGQLIDTQGIFGGLVSPVDMVVRAPSSISGVVKNSPCRPRQMSVRSSSNS